MIWSEVSVFLGGVNPTQIRSKADQHNITFRVFRVRDGIKLYTVNTH